MLDFSPNLTGVLFGLVKDLQSATKIAKAGLVCKLQVHNFDSAARLITATQVQKPVLIVVDWDRCEVEAYKVLKELKQNADLNGVPLVGFAAGNKLELCSEAERAGCLRVYTRTEFFNECELIFARYRP